MGIEVSSAEQADDPPAAVYRSTRRGLRNGVTPTSPPPRLHQPPQTLKSLFVAVHADICDHGS